MTEESWFDFQQKLRDFSLLKNVQTPLWGTLSLLLSMYQVFSRGIEQPGREANHSLPSTTTVKHKRSYSSTPHYFMTYTGTQLPVIRSMPNGISSMPNGIFPHEMTDDVQHADNTISNTYKTRWVL